MRVRRCPGGAVTVTVNVSLTLRGLKAVVAAMHALFCQFAGLKPDSIPIRTDATSTVLSAALKQRCGTRSCRSVNVTGVGGDGRRGGRRRRQSSWSSSWSWWSWSSAAASSWSSSWSSVGGGRRRRQRRRGRRGGGRRRRRVVVVVVVGVVGGGAVGVHSSSAACTDVGPSVTVTRQLLDRKLEARTRNLPLLSARLLADDSAEVTRTVAFGTAPRPRP